MTRRQDGTYQQQITVYEFGQKKTKYFYGKTKREVLQKISEYKNKSSVGKTFEKVADEWWDYHERTISPNTIKSYTAPFNRAEEYFGKTAISLIRTADITAYIDCILEKYGKSVKTAKNHVLVINLIFKYAVKRGYIGSNPASQFDIPKGLTKKKRTMPSDSEISVIKLSTDSQMGMFAYFILYSGLRRSELLSLTWEDIDFKNHTISVNKSRYQYNNKIYLKAPKTEAGARTVPLLNKLAEKLSPSTGLVFPGKDGNIMKERQFELDWNKFKKDHNISCNPHELRHAYSTMLFEANVSPKDMQNFLGHAQFSTTMDIYTDIRKAHENKIKDEILDVDISVN